MSPRTSKDPNKIKYVYLVRGRWVYRPYIKPADRKGQIVDKNGFLKPIRLGAEGDPRHLILARYAEAVKMVESGIDRNRLTLRWIADEYEKSTKYAGLATGSKKKIKTLRRVLNHEMKSGVPTLGDAYIHEISKPIVMTIQAKRLDNYRENGRDGKSYVNGEISYLSSLASWATLYFDEVKDNPFKVPKLEDNVRTRYVTHDEYWIQHDLSGKVSSYLPVFMELTYLLASRGIETTDITLEDTEYKDDNGEPAVRVRRRKGSDTTYIRRDDRLDAAIQAAKDLHKTSKISGKYLLPGRRGPKLKKTTVDDAMRKLRMLMQEKGLTSRHTSEDGREETEKPLFWTMHDLKRKGISDAKDNRIAGHRSESMRSRYDVKVRSFKTPE